MRPLDQRAQPVRSSAGRQICAVPSGVCASVCRETGSPSAMTGIAPMSTLKSSRRCRSRKAGSSSAPGAGCSTASSSRASFVNVPTCPTRQKPPVGIGGSAFWLRNVRLSWSAEKNCSTSFAGSPPCRWTRSVPSPGETSVAAGPPASCRRNEKGQCAASSRAAGTSSARSVIAGSTAWRWSRARRFWRETGGIGEEEKRKAEE